MLSWQRCKTGLCGLGTKKYVFCCSVFVEDDSLNGFPTQATQEEEQYPHVYKSGNVNSALSYGGRMALPLGTINRETDVSAERCVGTSQPLNKTFCATDIIRSHHPAGKSNSHEAERANNTHLGAGPDGCRMFPSMLHDAGHCPDTKLASS
jgi:hypothetical protein